MLKNKASLRAVSAVIARRPAIISPMQRRGAPMDLASRYCVISEGLKKSFKRLSPG